MSVDLSKTPQKGFLRDFHFSTMGEVVIDELFGDVERPSWMDFKIDHARDPASLSFVFGVMMKVEPLARESVKSRAGLCAEIVHIISPNIDSNVAQQQTAELMTKPDKELRSLATRLNLSTPMQAFWRSGPKYFGHTFKLPQSFIEQFRNDVPKVFAHWVKKVLLESAYRIYEFDPRKGWRHDGMSTLPVCPLFDPPEDFSRTGLPFESRNEGSMVFPTCAFCGKEHTAANPPVWVGANMMWVHPECRRDS